MLFFVRVVLPGLMVVGAFVMLFVAESRTVGLEGFFMGIGAAIALTLMNLMWRAGFEGDKERDREEAARRFYTKHGRWPDE